MNLNQIEEKQARLEELRKKVDAEIEKKRGSRRQRLVEEKECLERLSEAYEDMAEEAEKEDTP